MKHYVALVVLLLLSSLLVAQAETQPYKDVVGKLVMQYNSGQFDAIFNLLSADMQAVLPLEKTRAFFTGLKVLGAITKCDFVKFKDDVALYKMYLSQGVRALFISLDENARIAGFRIDLFVPDDVPQPPRTVTPMRLPFEHEWLVVWGGDTMENNYHLVVRAQKNAFDFLMADKDGKTFKTNGQKNEDFYCFGEKLVAPCDGEVVLAVDGIKDNVPGEMDQSFLLGNVVVLKTIGNEYIFLCHFKQHSVAVRAGQKVKRGQLLGQCGNSGHSSQPHLHFHVQNIEDIATATGIKCFFDSIQVNGEKRLDYSPVRNEKVANTAGR